MVTRCTLLAGILAAWLLHALPGYAGPSRSPDPAPASAMLIVGATLIDGTGSAPIEDSVIRVEDGLIRSIGSGGDRPAVDGVEVIDATGKFIVPGIVDAHTHIDSVGAIALTPEQTAIVRDYYPRAFLYHGVTTVLNMSAHDLEGVLEKRERVEREPRTLLPRIYTGASTFTVDGGWGGRHGGGLKAMPEIQQRVDDYAAQDIDLVKIINEEGLGSLGVFPRITEAYFAEIVRLSEARGLPVFVHATDEAEYLDSIAFRPRAMAHGLFTPQAAGSAVIRGLLEGGTFVVPTIVLFESFYSGTDAPALLDDPLLQASVPDFILQAMHDERIVADTFGKMNEILRMDAAAWARSAVRDLKANTRLFAESGIPIAVGTDGGGAVVHSFQGYNTPREMEILAECCLSNMAAIVAATRTAAQIMDDEDTFGTVQPGRSADFLILNADPLADIRAVRDFDRLVLRGQLIDRSDLTYRAFISESARMH